MRVIIIFIIFLGLVVGCASKPPKQQQNICSIFEQKSSWYRIINKSEEKWGAPIHVQMAIMRQESAFQNRIKPERTKLLGIIPWKRKSSSLGYTQEERKRDLIIFEVRDSRSVGSFAKKKKLKKERWSGLHSLTSFLKTAKQKL